MLSVNKVILLGNLGRDMELRQLTSANHTVGNFSIATTYSYKKNEEWQNETTWHNIVVFNPSDYLVNSLVKGQGVYVEGRLQKRHYDNKDGVTIYVVEVIADKIVPLDKQLTRDTTEDDGGDGASDVENDGETNDDLPF